LSTVAIGSIAAAGIGAIGANVAAGQQAGAAKSAQQLQAEEAANALAFQKQEFATQQANEAPFLKAGQGAVTQLASMLPSLTAPYAGGPFVAPTAAQAAATPGEQFMLQQGTEALNNSAAGEGALNTGATGAALQRYGEGLASTDYNNVYNQAQQTYNTNYNVAQNNQANAFNRYAALAGLGQVTAGQLGQQGAQTAGNISNIDLTTGAQQGGDINLAGAANASGYAGATNAVTGGINNIGQMLMLQALLGGGPGGNNTPVPGYG
jgi:hypothetical protein